MSRHVRTPPPAPAPSGRLGPLRRATLLASAVALVVPLGVALAAPAQARPEVLRDVAVVSSGAAVKALDGRVIVGADGDVATLQSRAGTSIADHNYGDFAGSVPRDGRMLTVNSSASWAEMAAAAPGSALYANIVRWAQDLKTRGPILLAYQHEPETTANMRKGSPAQFQAAFRRVVTIMRQAGATNLLYTWQMTAWSFRASTGAREYAGNFYPGDAYVDVVSADAYNWNTCGEGRGRQQDLSFLAAKMLAFARAHGKRAALPEYGSHANAQRAQWIDNAHSWLAQNKNTIVAAFYFNRPPTNSANSNCVWTLSSAAEYAAFSRMARDTANFTP